MNTPEHSAIVRLALDCLPGPAARFWKPLRGALLDTCMLPDQVAIPLLRGERGPWRQYFPPRLPRFNFEQTRRTARAFLPANRFYLGRIIDRLRRGDTAEAARFAGVYSHYIGDFAQPAHHYELEIGALLPPPRSMRNSNYHRMVEDIPSGLRRVPYRARLLGASKAELLFRLEGRYAALYRRAVAAVIPMVRSIYRRRNDLATRALNPVVADCARLMADVCHTCHAIAHGEFAARDLARLRSCDLREIEPHVVDVEYNFSRQPLVDVIKISHYGRAEPFRLYRRERGRRVAREVKGIGLIPHALPLKPFDPIAALEYRLPKGVFTRFEAEIGLLAGADRQAPSRFSVIADGRTRFRSGQLRPGDPSLPVSVDIARSRRLRLLVRTDGSTDKLAHPVWGIPRLIK